jgi:hypothetical protein
MSIAPRRASAVVSVFAVERRVVDWLAASEPPVAYQVVNKRGCPFLNAAVR